MSPPSRQRSAPRLPTELIDSIVATVVGDYFSCIILGSSCTLMTLPSLLTASHAVRACTIKLLIVLGGGLLIGEGQDVRFSDKFGMMILTLMEIAETAHAFRPDVEPIKFPATDHPIVGMVIYYLKNVTFMNAYINRRADPKAFANCPTFYKLLRRQDIFNYVKFRKHHHVYHSVPHSIRVPLLAPIWKEVCQKNFTWMRFTALGVLIEDITDLVTVDLGFRKTNRANIEEPKQINVKTRLQDVLSKAQLVAADLDEKFNSFIHSGDINEVVRFSQIELFSIHFPWMIGILDCLGIRGGHLRDIQQTGRDCLASLLSKEEVAIFM